MLGCQGFSVESEISLIGHQARQSKSGARAEYVIDTIDVAACTVQAEDAEEFDGECEEALGRA